VANIRASGPANNTIIPSSVTANVSFRLVPNQVRLDVTSNFVAYETNVSFTLGQSLDEIVEKIETHCKDVFADIAGDMSFEVRRQESLELRHEIDDIPHFRSTSHTGPDGG
jgi:acetylornithine deacetylase/succinyl-diaminopimelate desuccinylase-like protein